MKKRATAAGTDINKERLRTVRKELGDRLPKVSDVGKKQQIANLSAYVASTFQRSDGSGK